MELTLLYFVRSIILAACAPLFVGVIRAMKARYQGREGASVFQPYLDLRKLFTKDEVLPEDASWVFSVAPYLIFGVSLAVAGGVPLLGVGDTGVLGNLFVFVYAFALCAFFLALAGIDAGSSFGGFGSSREMTFAAIAEGVLLFSLLPLALLAGSTNFGDIAEVVRDASYAQLLPVVVAGIAYFVALLAENMRIPVDNPSTHLELTMVHEAMILEYSGKRLALMEWASWLKLMVFVSVAASVFVPWGAVDPAVPSDLVTLGIALIVFAVKCAVIAFSIATVESVFAKLRIFRIPRLLFTALLIGAVALALVTGS